MPASFLNSPPRALLVPMLLLLPPLLVYLGLHVVKREVIFVDLALAQVATLGTCVALLTLDAIGAGRIEYLVRRPTLPVAYRHPVIPPLGGLHDDGLRLREERCGPSDRESIREIFKFYTQVVVYFGGSKSYE